MRCSARNPPDYAAEPVDNGDDRQVARDLVPVPAVVAFDEVVDARRLFGRPDYLVTVAVADVAAYEAFVIERLNGLPAVERTVSHQTMKHLKG